MNQHIRFFHQVMRLATRDLSLLRRWPNRRTDASPPPDPGPTPESAQRLCHPLPGDVLLARPARTVLVEQIWQRTAVSREQFAQLYLAPLQRYAHLVQEFPASQDGHYRYAGGMLDQALHRVICALRLRQACLLPAGAPPEEQAEQAEAWTAAVAYAVLLQDLGKLVVDLRIEHDDGTPWRPWQGPLQRPYRVHYPAERPYRLQAAATALLHVHVLDPELLAWLSSYDVLWTQMLYMMSGQEAHADILGDLAFQAAQAVADQASC